MISVDQALAHLFALVTPSEAETLPLRRAAGRVLSAPIIARRSQPPFRASVMDGYGVSGDHSSYQVIGEAAAGHGYGGAIKDGQAVRIFTGAPLPEGATRVVIQEDVTREGDRIILAENADSQAYIREIGVDFHEGDQIDAPRRLTPSDLALAASMNAAEVTVARRPKVAILATGDELVQPGETPGADQIIASNGFGLSAMLEEEGAEARLLPIARDARASLEAAFDLVRGADLLVTLGGASVGDHDIVGQVAADLGLERAFYKIAMRPGKPLMAGRIGDMAMVGLPGNPVSSMVCGHIFLRPMIRAMQGLPAVPLARSSAPLAVPVSGNGPREHYMRAYFDGETLTPAERQDSSLLRVLSGANALVIRPPHGEALTASSMVPFIRY